MTELEAFDRRLERAFGRLVEVVRVEVDAAAVARRVAREQPRRRTGVGRWPARGVPRVAVLLLLFGLLVGFVAGLVAGSRPDLVMTASPDPTSLATPLASGAWAPTSPEYAISTLLRAWHEGDPATARQLYVDEPARLVIGSLAAFDREGARHFDVIDDARGWVYWEPRGLPTHAGAYWAQPSVAGFWDPGADVIAVFRFDANNRITTQWTIVSGAVPEVLHEERQATPASPEIEALLETCTAVDTTRPALSACYTPEADFWISADEPGTGWTEEYVGADEIQHWIDSASVLHGTSQSGDVIVLGNLAVRAFTSGRIACAAGVEVFELSADQSRIAGHWAFCGPDAIPAGLIGTWSASGTRPPILSLGACVTDEECGTFERFDGVEQCVYTLRYRAALGDIAEFMTTDASSFNCGWSPWADSLLDVRLAADGTVDVWVQELPSSRYEGLIRAEDTPDASANPHGGVQE